MVKIVGERLKKPGDRKTSIAVEQCIDRTDSGWRLFLNVDCDLLDSWFELVDPVTR